MVRGSGAHYLRQALWKCEDAGSFGAIKIIESVSPCTNNMANDTAIDDDEHQEATCQEGTLSEPQDVTPTKKQPRSSTPGTGELLTRCRCPYQLPIASSSSSKVTGLFGCRELQHIDA